MTERRVFVSYSRHDRDFVERLSTDLRARGISLWIDIESAQPGALWAQEIAKGLDESSALIFISSENSTKSSWMDKELVRFLKKSKPVIPAILDDAGEAHLPAGLKKFQWADFRPSYDVGLQSVLAGLGVADRKVDKPEQGRQQSKGYVFISYADDDSDFVTELRGFLKERGYGYWDYEDSNRNYHSQLFIELEGVITEASATLSVLSEAWKRSRWTVREYFFSEDVGIPVFLLKVKEMEPTLAIAGLTFIDFTRNAKDGFRKLERELARKGL